MPTVLLLALLFNANSLIASELDLSQSTGSAAAIETVPPSTAIDDFFVAARENDWVRVASLLADDFMFYGDDAIVLNRNDFLLAMRQDEMRIDSLELSNVESFLSDDRTLAFVRYSLSLRSEIDGERHDVETVETVVLRRANTASRHWLFVQNHASIKAS